MRAPETNQGLVLTNPKFGKVFRISEGGTHAAEQVNPGFSGSGDRAVVMQSQETKLALQVFGRRITPTTNSLGRYARERAAAAHGKPYAAGAREVLTAAQDCLSEANR